MEIENYIEKNLDEIQLNDFLQLIEYFSTTIKEKQETIRKFMKLFEERIFRLMKFFNPTEVIQIFYGYLKTNIGSDELFRKLENQALDQMEKFTIDELEKLIVLISTSPMRYAILDAIEKEILKRLKILKPYHFPTIFFIFAMNDFGSPMFYSVLTNKITNSIFLYSPEQISKLAWGYAVKSPNSELLFKKVQEYIVEKTEKFSANEISNIVWSFTEAKKGTNLLFVKLEEQIFKNSSNFTIKEVAKILWGYVNKMALTQKTIQGLYETIKVKLGDADTWDLATILWAFSRFQTNEFDEVFKIAESKIKEICEEMNNYEFVTSLRAYSEKKLLRNQTLDFFLVNLQNKMDSMNEQEIILSINSLINIEDSNTHLQLIIEKLLEKLKDLENKRGIITKN